MEWSSVTGRGGGLKKGGQVSSLQKGGTEKVSVMLKGGGAHKVLR